MKRGKQVQDVEEASMSGPRSMDSGRGFPQRKKPRPRDVPPALQPTSVSKLVNGVWEQIYGGIKMDLAEIVRDGYHPRVILPFYVVL